MAKSKEPLVWSLFAGGGMVAAMLFPICIILTGFLLAAGTLSRDRLHDMVTSPLGKLLLLVLIALPLVHAMHRLKHTVHDMGLHLGALGGLIFYGGAAGLSALGAYFLFLG